jgi:transposase
MIHIGIDHHKKYCYVVAMADSGEVVWEGEVASRREPFEELKSLLPAGEPTQCVLEAGWNWGKLYDALEDIGLNPKLANPVKTRMIAESFVKTDKIDATTHAILLKAGMSPLVHVPVKEIRDQKNLIRRRFWLVQMQTALKNRVHSILDRNHQDPPELTDLFGGSGRAWLNGLILREPDEKILRADLALLDELRDHVKETERWVTSELKDNLLLPTLLSLPGIGKTFGALIALEIDTIDRFPSAPKLCAYSGLVSSTYSSGGKTTHGHIIPANRHLRYAFVEAAWTAVRVSPYFRSFYRRLKARIGASKAIIATARKLCEITFYCLKQNREYVEKPYRFKSGRLEYTLA